MSKKKFSVIVADPPWEFSDRLKMSDVKRGAEANYDIMSNSDIEQLPIKKFIAPTGSILALWVPSSLLQEGLDTMKAWGFSHKQTYVWVKTKNNPFGDEYKALKKRSISLIKYLVDNKSYLKNIKSEIDLIATTLSGALGFLKLNDALAFFMGRIFRQTHEICLIGISNSKIYKRLENKSQRSVSFAPNLKHSAKPEHLQNSLDIMFPKGNRLELFARRHRPGWVCLGNEICNGEDIRVSLAKL